MKNLIASALLGGALLGWAATSRAATLQFNGSSAYVSAGSRADLKLTGTNLTLEAWIKPSGPGWHASEGGTILCREGEYILARFPDGTLRYAVTTTSPGWVWNNSGLVAPSNQWTHVALTYDGTAFCFYVNGTLRILAGGSGAIGDADAARNDFYIGNRQMAATYFQGQIDEVRLWRITRTQAEIIGFWNRRLAGNESGLVAYYPMDEGLGTMTADGTGRGCNGTFVNAPLWNVTEDAVAPVAMTRAPTAVATTGALLNATVNTNGALTTNRFEWGAASPALTFDGVDDLVRITNFGNRMPTTEVTVEFWQRVHATNKAQSTFGLEADLTTNRFQAQVPWQDGVIYWDFGNSSGNGRLTYAPPSSILGTWQHFALVSSVASNCMRIYRNGVLEQSKSGASSLARGQFDLTLGKSGSGYFDGDLDEFRVWNVVRGAEEIRSGMYARVPPNASGLVAYYRLDEGTGLTTVDVTGSSANGALVGGPTWLPSGPPVFDQVTAAQPVAGSNLVLDLNGVSAHVRVPPGIWFSNEFTIETWVFERSYNWWSRVIDFGNGAPLDNVLLALSEGSSGKPNFGVSRGTSSQSLSAPDPLPLNQWVHLAATLKSNVGTIYVNGVAAMSGPLTAPSGTVTRTNNYLGRSNWADTNANALLDDLRLWNVARTPDQIRQSMFAAVPPDAPNLILNYGFDEPSGATALDSRSASPQNGTLTNGASRLAALPASSALSTLVPGTIYHVRGVAQNPNGLTAGGAERFVTPALGGGTALAFDGTNDLVRIANFANRLPTNEITVEFWQRVTSQKPQATFALEPDNTANRFAAMAPWSDGAVYWDFGNIASGGRLQYTPPVSILGAWHHFALVSSVANNAMRIYRNGVLEASKTGAVARTAGTNDLVLGRVAAAYFAGELDEFRIWNLARAAAEIARDRNVRLAGNEAGLVAYYRMDEGAGLALLDSSTNANHGLLVNGPLYVPSTAPVRLPQPITLESAVTSLTSAVLNGLVKPGETASSAWFQWGADTSYGGLTAVTNVGVGLTNAPVSAVLTDLAANVTYHYRLVASNSLGVAYGADRTFTILPVTSLGDTGAGSLRQTIANAPAGATVVLNVPVTVSLTSGELSINKDLTLLGGGAGAFGLSGANNSRVLNIAAGVTVNLTGLSIRSGLSAPSQPGGGIYNAGVLTLNDCIVENNATGSGATGGTGAVGGAGGDGGGIYNHNSGVLTLNRCTVRNNSGGYGGGGGNGRSGSDGSWSGGNGGAGGVGGNGGAGGGIYSAGTLVLNGSTFYYNYSGGGGDGGHGGEGGWGTYEGGNGGRGGNGGNGGAGAAICASGVLSLRQCTVSGNGCGSGGSGNNGGQRGGGGAGGSGNHGGPGTGGNGGHGGAIFNNATLELASCTLAYNSAGWAGAGGTFNGTGSSGLSGAGGGITNQAGAQAVRVVNTILARNTSSGTADDVKGGFTSLGHNLLFTASGSTGFGTAGDLLGQDPGLGALADNGGGLLTRALLDSSPAINAGDNTQATDFSTDQRGFPRLACAYVDIGAVEFNGCPWPLNVAAQLPSEVSATSLTLQGTVNPNFADTVAWFEWGETTSYGQTTPPTSLPAQRAVLSLASPLSRLTAGITYHGRVVASNGTRVVFSADQPFVVLHPWALTALQCDGVDDYVQLTAVSALAMTTNLTLEAWVNPSTLVAAGTILCLEGRYVLGLNNNTVRYALATTTTRWDWTTTSFAVPNGAWTHLALTYDNTNVFLYANGTCFHTNRQPGPLLDFTAGYDWFTIGARKYDAYWREPFAGLLDEIRVWNVTRTPAEIAQDYRRALTGTEPGLVAYYRFNESSGDALNSGAEGSTLNGTVNGPLRVPSGAGLFLPLVTTSPADAVTSTKATLHGSVYPASIYPAQAYFEYGPSPNFGSQTGSDFIRAGMSSTNVEEVLGSLQPGTRYYFRLVAWNVIAAQYATNYGATLTFDTPVVGFGYPVTTHAGSGQNTTAPRHVADEAGNLYLAGLFSESAQFKSTLRAENSPTNAFLAKLLRGGDWDWAVNIPVTNGQLQIKSLALQNGGTNVVVAGAFSGTATFGPTNLTATNGTRAFLARFGPTNWTWAVMVGTNSSANAVAASGDGGIYVAGGFSGSAGFGTSNLTATGGSDVFLARLNSGGQVVWAKRAGGTGNDVATALALNSEGSKLFVTGSFYGTNTSFGGTLLTSAGAADLFFVTLNPTNGDFGSAKRAGGAGADQGTALAADPFGLVYLLGQFDGAADFDGSPLPELVVGQTNLFIAQVNATGVLQPTRTVAQSARAEAIAVDRATGVAYVAGDFADVMTYGTNRVQAASRGSRDVFLARLQPDGEGGIAWKLHQIGNIGLETAGSVSVDAKGSVVVSGTYAKTLVLGHVQLETANGQEIFLARLDADGTYEHNRWTIGSAITVPREAQDTNSWGTPSEGRAIGYPYSIEILAKPNELGDSSDANSFSWSDAEKKLYAIRPVTARIKWPLSTSVTNLANVATVVGRCYWPEQPLTNVAGAPVEVEGPGVGLGFSFGELAFNTNGATVTPTTRGAQQFQIFRTATNASGFNVLRYTQPGGGLVFDVVFTRPYGNWVASVANFVGKTLERTGHEDPTGKNGYVLLERSFHDAEVYDRVTRSGPIIPVNRTLAEDPSRDLVVVWYRTNKFTGVAWGCDPVRYTVNWPASTPGYELVVASGQGFALSPAADYPQAQVYHQPNTNLAGFNPNEEHAFIAKGTLYALRCDLNAGAKASEPFVLLKYRIPGPTTNWTIQVFQVGPTNAAYTFDSFSNTNKAGREIQLPESLSLLTVCTHSNRIAYGSNYAHQAWTGKIYAKAQGYVQLQYWYPVQPGFYTNASLVVGACVPWMSQYQQGPTRGATHLIGEPALVGYDLAWPDDVKTLEFGDTLTTKKNELPDLLNWQSAQIIFDEADPAGTNAANALVRLYDPISERVVQLAEDFKLPDTIAKANDRGQWVFSELPYPIRSRLRYDEQEQQLSFGGLYKKSTTGEPLLLPNVLSARERDRILDLSSDAAFRRAVTSLYDLTRNPNQVDADRDGQPDTELRIGLITEIRDGDQQILIGPVVLNLFTNFVTTVVSETVTARATNIIQEPLGALKKAMTAALHPGSGYVTLVENDDPRLPDQPINLHLVRILGTPFRGDLKVLYPDSVFDERLALRHSGDFAGEPQNFEFEWYYQPDQTGVSPALPEGDHWNGWIRYPTQVSGTNGFGFNDIILGEGGELSSLMTLGDNWVLCRYRGFASGGPTAWSDWVGEPGGGRAILAEGWIKRVMKGLNAFDSRVKDFHVAEAATFASMIQQAGQRYEGPVAFNPNPDYLNQLGLIESYETVLDRGRKLSIDGIPAVNFGPANSALLLAAGRIADLYMLLGNEALADASDPTIAFTTTSAAYGNLAPSIFCFQNQLDSPLEEELALLRGRDDRGTTVRASPFYNRLVWNFTLGEGEVAYVQNYNISDQNKDGFLDEQDAALLYPQGHGDAWGHYLTAIMKYYELLRHPNYTWIPRPEAVLVGGVSVQVDYQDERKFAAAAAAKAKAGAEIVNLTYRQKYVEDPAGQWQGYKDTDPDRAWGVSEWATRAGTAAYFDWVVANAILPDTDPDTNHVGLQKIDRTTVPELGEIAAQFAAIEAQLAAVDRGLNPLGVAPGAMPFDIDPSQVAAGKTHFDQIYDRALKTMENTLTLFDHANTLSQNLRRTQDTVDEFGLKVAEQERDYKNRLIETFGYPYAGDIGPAGTYPSDYDGPDLYHYMYVNASDLTGEATLPSQVIKGYFKRIALNGAWMGLWFDHDSVSQANSVPVSNDVFGVDYPLAESGAYQWVAPASWSTRRAQGKLQTALSGMLKARAQLNQGLIAYNNLRLSIQDAVDLFDLQRRTTDTKLAIRSAEAVTLSSLSACIIAAKITEAQGAYFLANKDKIFTGLIESLPKTVGLANDVFAPTRGILNSTKVFAEIGVQQLVFNAIMAQESFKQGKEITKNLTDLAIQYASIESDLVPRVKAVEQLVRQEAEKRVELSTLQESLQQAYESYLTTLASGQRLLEERYNFRVKTSAQIQQQRYQDMAFRIFQNDALQKYRAQFDLAARYVYLAAKAYDYETCLLNAASGAGSKLLTDIVRQRTVGQVVRQGTTLLPVSGRHGLADPLARLGQNFEVYRGQLGFTTPETETGKFSLRSELFRIQAGDLRTNALNGLVSTNTSWPAQLQQCRVPDLWQVPEFRRFCRPFAPESAGPQPGLVIRIPTTITFGLNYFGWPLGPGDSAYDPSRFATKVRSAGVWFKSYSLADLSMTPRVYLVPAGLDILRSPSGNDLETREFNVVDQKLPVPFPIGASDLSNPNWIPINDSLSEAYGDIRRFSSFRAYHDRGDFTESEATKDTRLIGRSVWNTQWLLIIPGGTFLYDPNRGLDTFIATVGDIRIFFQTYSYSGN